MSIDRLIVEFDKSIRTVFASAVSVRPVPGSDLPEPALPIAERQHVAALMRVNHVGEVCAQALYQGQAVSTNNADIRNELAKAAQEETEHLAWTEARIVALGGRKSAFNPLWYAGAFAMGHCAGRMGDGWNLGFLAETERQVGAHLEKHLQLLPVNELKSRAILLQMHEDELSHAETATQLGAQVLPVCVKAAMKLASKVMTKTAYYI